MVTNTNRKPLRITTTHHNLHEQPARKKTSGTICSCVVVTVFLYIFDQSDLISTAVHEIANQLRLEREKIKTDNQPAMQEFTQYTSLFAPVLYFFSGIAIVILLNKFIGKNSAGKETK